MTSISASLYFKIEKLVAGRRGSALSTLAFNGRMAAERWVC